MVVTVNEDNFSSEVLDSSVPVLVNFWAPWCGICRMIDPFLSKFQTEWGEQLKLVSINADENLKLANTYRLTTLPTVLLVRQGSVLHRLEGFHSRDDLNRAADCFRHALTTICQEYSLV
jgi:thioredoxin 1